MKRLTCLFFVMVLLFSMLGATPFTTMGNMKVPNAYSLPHKMIEVSVVNYFTPDVADDFKYDPSGVINFGLYDRATAGFVYNSNGIAYGNLKVQLVYETEVLPAIAIGVENLFSPIEEYREDGTANEMKKLAEYQEDYNDIQDIDDYIQNSMYFVLSKATVLRGIPFAPYLETTLHLGMGTRRFYGNDDLSQQLSGFFGGVDLNPNKYTTVFLEMDGYNFNAGAGLNWKNLTFRVGAYRLEELDRRDPKFAANIMYTFDKFSSVKNSEKNRQFTYGSTITTTHQGKVISRQSQEAGRNPMMDKLDEIRANREKRQKELEEIRKILEEK